MSNRPAAFFRVLALVFTGILAWQLTRVLRAPDPLAALDRVGLNLPAAGNGDAASAAPRPQTAPAIPPTIQKQVDHVRSSEVFGAIPQPLPMAVLGIGGWDAFIRTPAGQTEVMRVGDTAGGVKLLRIGTNRVLVEHEGQSKELILYPELGGDSLLPKL